MNRIYTLLLAVCLAIASGTATQCAIKDVTGLISLLQQANQVSSRVYFVKLV